MSGKALLLRIQSKSTGQLSVTVYIANAVGCVARIFTSMQEGGGYAMVRGFLLGENCCSFTVELETTPLAKKLLRVTTWVCVMIVATAS